MTYASEVLADSPVVYWKLDETSGNMLDSSGNSRPATTVTAVNRGQTGAVDGGSSIQRSGTSSSGVSRPNEAALQVTAVTLEILFRTAATGIQQSLCGKWAGSGLQRSCQLAIDSSNRLTGHVRTDVTSSVTLTDGSGINICDDQWHHAAVTWEPTTDMIRLYLDGKQVQSGLAAGTTMLVGTDPLIVGSANFAGRSCDRLDEFAYYGTALSAARIKAHAQEFNPALDLDPTPFEAEVLADSPLAAWHLTELTGQFQDYSGNDRHTTTNTGIDRQQTGLVGSAHAISPTSGATNSGASRPDEAAYDAVAVSVEFVAKHTTGLAVEQWFGGRWGASTANRVIALKVSTADVLQVGVKSDSGGDTFYNYTGSRTWADGNYHHFVVTYDPGTDTLKLYIDGVSDQSWTHAGTTSFAATGSLAVGGIHTVGRMVAGVDEFAYYTTALSAARVQAHAIALGIDSTTYVQADVAFEQDLVPQYSLVETATNLFTNPSFETNTTGWAALGAGTTLTRITTDFHEGVACCQVVTPGTNPSEGIQLSGSDIAVSSSTQYAAGQWVKFPVGKTIRAALVDTVGGTGTSFADTTATGDWQFVSVTRTSSATTTAMDWRVYEPHETAAITFLVDEAIFVRGSIPEVFHGDKTDTAEIVYAWTGAAHASTSTRTRTTTVGNTAFESDSVPSAGLRIGAGVATETDTVPTIPTIVNAGVGIETDVAIAASFNQALSGGLATEADSATAASLRQTVAAALESDTAIGLGLAWSASPALEVDTAVPPTEIVSGFFAGVAIETDVAIAAVVAIQIYAGVATEADSALPASTETVDNILAGVATETDTAPTVAITRTLLSGVAAETDSALGVAATSSAGVGFETDTAVAPNRIDGPFTHAIYDDVPSLYWRMDGENLPRDRSGEGRHADWNPNAGIAAPGLLASEPGNQALQGGERSLLDPASVGDIGTMWAGISSHEFLFSATESGDLLVQIFNAPFPYGTITVRVNVSGQIELRYDDPEFLAGPYLITGPVVTDGRAHHVVATHYNDIAVSDISLYLDGVKIGTTNVDYQDTWSTGQIKIVADAGNVVDELAIYQYELTPSQVFHHWQEAGWITAYETDSAPTHTVVADAVIEVTPVVEIDTAFPLAARITVGLATETDTAHGYVMPTLLVEGTGTLTIETENFIVIPEFQLQVLDDVLRRAPTAVTVSMAGGLPETDVRFKIDGVLVWTVQADTDGNLPVISLNVTPTIGGAVGEHIVSAEQTLPDNSVISSEDTYTLEKSPVIFPITMGADVDPVEVPGALVGDVRRWVWQDLMPQEDGGIGSWVMPINPTEMGSPDYEHTFSSRHTTAKTGRFHVSQAARTIVEWTFSGYAPDEEFINQLRAYRDLNRRFYIIDHHNRAWKVIISNLEVVPRLRHTFVSGGTALMNDWGSKYTVTAVIVEQDYLIPETP